MAIAAESVGSAADDAHLINCVRRGDESAYADLYQRYSAMAGRYAASRLLNRTDVDDVVAEVFSGVLAAMKNGRGPVGSFAPYLMTSLRHECQKVNRRRALECAAPDAADEPGATALPVDPFVTLDEVAVIRDAFESLSPRFRDVLWRLEVVDESNGQVARRYRTTPQAISMLAVRARRALGSAYLARHLAAEATVHEIDPACRQVRPLLAHVVRKTAERRRQRLVDSHLIECAMCRRARDELRRMNQHLRAMPLAPAAAAVAALSAASSGVGGALKAQIAAWWSSMTSAAATSGLAAVSLLSPVLLSQDAGTPNPVSAEAVPEAAAATGPSLLPAAAPFDAATEETGGATAALAPPAILPSPDHSAPTGDATTAPVVVDGEPSAETPVTPTMPGVAVDAAPPRDDANILGRAQGRGRGVPSSPAADRRTPAPAANAGRPPQAANPSAPPPVADGSPPPEGANPVPPPPAANASPPPFASDPVPPLTPASPPAVATSTGDDGQRRGEDRRDANRGNPHLVEDAGIDGGGAADG